MIMAQQQVTCQMPNVTFSLVITIVMNLKSSLLKFLGVHIDNHLSLSNHVDQVVSKCSSIMFLLRQLKILGMNSDGLNTFYCTNIRSLLSYAAPAWCTLLGDTNLEKWEKVQRRATRIILSDYEYNERLKKLCIPSLANFLPESSQRHFSKIVSE